MKPPKEREHHRRFQGTRTDTEPVRVETTEDGFSYRKRRNGSLYPKNTSISVTESTRRIYAILHDAGGYNNYDELLLDIALPIVRNKSLPVFRLPTKSLGLSEGIVESLKRAVEQAIVDKSFKTRARKKAFEKRRYHPRKIRTY